MSLEMKLTGILSTTYKPLSEPPGEHPFPARGGAGSGRGAPAL